jgi:hypothetical protein
MSVFVLSWWDLIGNFCSVVLTFDLIDCQVIKKKPPKTTFFIGLVLAYFFSTWHEKHVIQQLKA